MMRTWELLGRRDVSRKAWEEGEGANIGKSIAVEKLWAMAR